MCILNLPVSVVSDTRLLLCLLQSHSDGKDYVLTLYSNRVQLDPSHPNNAMILPIPTEGKSIELIDSTKWGESLLDALHQATHEEVVSNTLSINLSASSSPLKVFEVGSYLCSIADTIGEMERIDKATFTLNPKVKDIIVKFYPKGYSFLIMRIAESKKFHPFAFAYPANVREGGSEGGEGKGKEYQCYLPTRHVHLSGKVSSWLKSLFPPSYENADDWNHEVYLWGFPHPPNSFTIGSEEFHSLTPPTSAYKRMHIQDAKKLIEEHFGKERVLIEEDQLRRWNIRGTHRNGDIMVKVAAAQVAQAQA